MRHTVLKQNDTFLFLLKKPFDGLMDGRRFAQMLLLVQGMQFAWPLGHEHCAGSKTIGTVLLVVGNRTVSRHI